MQYKIAVCLSGQPRTWYECHKNILSFFNNIAAPPGYTETVVDFFIHTWDRNTWKVTNKNERVVIPDDLGDYFNAVKFKKEHQNDVAARMPWHGLFTSFNESIMMKTQHEIENGFEYNLVFKSRLDVVFDKVPFEIPIIAPMVCYASDMIAHLPFENHQRNFNDIIFYSDSTTMDLLGNAYNWFYAQYPKYDMKSINARLGPGAILYRYMVHHGIHPEAGPTMNYCIMRETASHLDPDVQYKEIFDIHCGVYQ